MRVTRYRLFAAVTVFALVFGSTPQLQAELIASSNFLDGGDGTLADDVSGEGWAAEGWTLQDAALGGAIVPVNWSHVIPNYGVVTASTALQFTGSPLGAGVHRELAEIQNGDDIYISFLTKWETGVIDGNDFVIWYFNNNGGPNIGYKANEGSGDDGFDFVARTTGSTNQYAPTELEVGELYFVVGHLSKSIPGEGEFYDTYELWVNPSFDDFGMPQSISEGASNISEFTGVGVRSHQINPNGDEPDDLRFANLRIASDWASVFPPKPGVLPDPGDFNEDGVINMADFDILAANIYGHLDGVNGFSSGDMNRDGRIDMRDFHDFVGVFPAAAGALSVPEPSSLVLILPLFVLLGTTRSRRRA